MSRQICVGAYVSEAGAYKQGANVGGLLPTMLQNQPTAWPQSYGGSADDFLQRFESARAGDQRMSGLVAPYERGKIGIVGGNVGRVGDDQVVARIGRERLVPMTLHELHIGNLQSGGVSGGDDERVGGYVDGDDACVRALTGDRQCDCAAARPQIQDIRPASRIQVRQSAFHDQFGLRTRNQYRRRHLERQRPKFLMAGDVCDRLALHAPLDELLKRPAGLHGQFTLRFGMKPRTREPGHMREQQLRIQTR